MSRNGKQPVSEPAGATKRLLPVRASPTAQAVEALTRPETELIGSLELLAQSWRPQILAQVAQPLLQSMQGALNMLRVAEGHITPHGVWA